MKVLNVGGGSRDYRLPPLYMDATVEYFDCDARFFPDHIGDAADIPSVLPAGGFDVVYCSHVLEHIFPFEAADVVRGFAHVLNDDGFCHVAVPDIEHLIHHAGERKMALSDVIYQSQAGPITVRDLIYGYGSHVEFNPIAMSHKTGFSPKSLTDLLLEGGFKTVLWLATSNFEIHAVACKTEDPTPRVARLFGLEPGERADKDRVDLAQFVRTGERA